MLVRHGDPSLPTPPFVPAGTEAQQIAINEAARRLIEPHRLAPSEEPGVRFRADILRSRGWCVAPMERGLAFEEAERICSALRRAGTDELLGILVDTRDADVSEVLAFPVQPPHLFRFVHAHPGSDVMLAARDFDPVLLSDGEEIVVIAGPPAFVLDAVGGDAAAHAREWVDFLHELKGGYRLINDFYAPFALAPA